MYYQAGTSDNNIHQATGDGNNIHTLFLMNPSSNYIQGYTDTEQQIQQHQQHQQNSSNMIFLNGHALHSASVTHAPLQPPHFVGVPLPSDQGLIQRLWGGKGSHHMSQIPSSSAVVSAGSCGGGTTTDLTSQLGFPRPIPVSPPPQQQHQQGARGLSLSLSPHQQQISFNNMSTQNDHQDGTNNIVGRLDGISNMILGSKYLKIAQELLDEVVNVGKISNKLESVDKEKGEMNNESMTNLASDVNTTISGGESSKQKNGVAEITTAQRQELQMKKAKLVTMLEEVEQRYRQYHHQMQIIVSSFEQVAGIGSAKSYTQLALHAISKQFRCLKDAIVGQIKATNKNLGEEEQGLKIEGSRLKFVDHHLRQQRALQQLGMMQPNAWRPQRGLPERAVSVLRAWLFEHFLHPYPKDSDKIMLAKQTGLTRSQVSNWFINARVRLWKPMVEEMYLEEVKNNNQEPNSTSQENKNQNENQEFNKETLLVSKSSVNPQENSTEVSTSPNGGFSFIGSLNMEDQKNGKKPRNDMQNSPNSILSEESNKGFNNNPLMAAYTVGDFGRFNPHDHQQMATNFLGNNGVSLTLGLPPSDHQNLALQGRTHHQQSYNISNQNIELGTSHFSRMTNPQSITSFEDIDFQSGKRFSTQLLPDFVA